MRKIVFYFFIFSMILITVIISTTLTSSKSKVINADGIVTNIWLDNSSKLDTIMNNGIKYLFVDVGDTLSDGSLESSTNEFLAFVKQYEINNNYDFILMAYSEVNTYTHPLSEEFLDKYVEEYTYLCNIGFDGMLVDIEPVKFQDRDIYIKMLINLKEKLPNNKIISVYSGALIDSDNEWEWNKSFFEAVANRADIIVIPSYDAEFKNNEEYEAYLRNQISTISSSNFKTKFLYGVPTHKPYPEDMNISLSVYKDELKKHKNNPFIGVSIFSEWTMQQKDWETYANYKSKLNIFHFSIWAIFGLTLWIDVFTHIFIRRKNKIKINPYNPLREVSVIVPAHDEAEYIEKTIISLYAEKYPLKNVFVCGDAKSPGMREVVESLGFSNLIYLESRNVSKASKINLVTRTMHWSLGDYIYIRDSKVMSNPDCIENMISHFDSDDVGAVTSYGYLTKPSNFLSKFYYFGKTWTDEVGRFRKSAQEKRKAIFVICGASTMYRKDILLKHPVPYGSKTEDTYHTWKLQIHGIKIKVANDAVVFANDLDGLKFEGIIKQLKQAFRWSSGTIQCLYRENINLIKNKRLFFSTILPGLIESTMYALALLLLPLSFIYFTYYAISFIIGDTFFSLLATLILMPKKFFNVLIRYPGIFFYKYLNALVFLSSILVVSIQSFKGERFKWANEWKPL